MFSNIHADCGFDISHVVANSVVKLRIASVKSYKTVESGLSGWEIDTDVKGFGFLFACPVSIY